MTTEYIVGHSLPGRVRLYVPLIRESAGAVQSLRTNVTSIRGVNRVRVNELCSSVVVEFDPAVLSVEQDVLAACSMLTAAPPCTPEPQQALPIGRTRSVAGHSLLVIGLIGWLLPVMPGTPFVLAAVALLGKNNPAVQFSIRLLGQYFRRSRRWSRENPGSAFTDFCYTSVAKGGASTPPERRDHNGTGKSRRDGKTPHR